MRGITHRIALSALAVGTAAASILAAPAAGASATHSAAGQATPAATTYPVPYNLLGARPGSTLSPPGSNNFACKPSAAHPEPVVLVHGLIATAAENWGTMSPLLANNGYCVFALTYGLTPGNTLVGGLAPMEQSSTELAAFVDKVLAATGAKKVDLVGHSEGTVMPQYYMKFLGGANKVDKYVAIAPIYHGTTLDGIGSGLAAFEKAFPTLGTPVSKLVDSVCGSCQEFLMGSDFLKHLYADGVYAVQGVTYTTIMTKYDELVTPYTSGYLDAPNATNFVVQDGCPTDFSEHLSVVFDPRTAQIMLNALDPTHTKRLPCTLVLPGFGALQGAIPTS